MKIIPFKIKKIAVKTNVNIKKITEITGFLDVIEKIQESKEPKIKKKKKVVIKNKKEWIECKKVYNDKK